MRKKDYQLELTISLSSSLYSELETLMANEASIAQRKWGVTLDQKVLEEIFEHSRKQLEGKLNRLGHGGWRYKDENMNIYIKTPFPGVIKVDLTQNDSIEKDYTVVRTNSDWILSDEPGVTLIKLSEFKEYIEGMLKIWIKTAVFYGVGSYEQRG